MAKKTGMDFNEFNKLVQQTVALKEQFGAFLERFLLRAALDVLGQTKMLTPVDTGNLRNRWEITDVLRSGDVLYVVIFNPVEYASFVEDGHYQSKRFVPGEWRGDKFTYIPNHDKGMMLSERFVPGQHMAQISIDELRSNFFFRYNAEFDQFLAGLEVV